MYPNHLPERLLLLLEILIVRINGIMKLVFADPPDERGKRFNMKMPSLLWSLVASAAFLVALISMLYWLLTSLAG